MGKIKIKALNIKPSILVIFIFVIFLPMVNFDHHQWVTKDGMIDWDVKSYYAYLPAAIIYKDLSLEFTKENPEKFGKWIWPISTPNGKKGIITTMGLSFMYAPFFLIAHAVATLNPTFEADGYSLPYHFALGFSTYFYFILGLFVLRKILLNYYSERVTAFTLFAIGAGTNLFLYVTYAATMPHGYNFVIFILFIYFLLKWHTSVNYKNTIVLGLLAGLIALIRPTNIILIVLIPLFGVHSLETLKLSILNLLRNWKFVVLMICCFVVVWIPQFIYWYYLSGKIFYFSYGEEGGKFFFNNPQIWNVLISYKKGWYVYTPLMVIATLGIYFLFKQKNKFAVGITVFLILNIYVISSWWCWWYGGGFGMRPMIDSYGLMALPFAAFLKQMGGNKIKTYAVSFVVLVLVFFNLFQIKQYRNLSIHYWWMNKEAYWETFLKIRPTCKYWQVITIPNYPKAREGIYEATAPYDKRRIVTDEMLKQKIINVNRNNLILIDSLRIAEMDSVVKVDSILTKYAQQVILNKKAGEYFKMLKVEFFIKEINTCASWKKEIEKKARRKGIPFNEMAQKEAERVYQAYCEKYDPK
jgi:hypothetical protein